MYLITNKKEECCGCSACVRVCPKECIHLELDDSNGHLYPKVDKECCVGCNLCEKVCPFENLAFVTDRPSKAYLYAGTRDDVLKSASGGGFYAIAKQFLKVGGCVFGAKFDDNLKVVHTGASNVKELELLRKSKYIQSDMSRSFEEVEIRLKNGGKVLFSGVPCQVSALTNYLKQKHVSTECLTTIGLLCHGVPSQAIFDKYMDEHENKTSKHVVRYVFRNKQPYHGIINSRTALIEYSDGSNTVVGTDKDPFLRMYYNRLAYRPSCGKCVFATVERVADITLADAWGVEKISPEYNSLSGVSLVLTASEKGKILVEESCIDDIRNVDIDWAVNSQGVFKRPTDIHKNNEDFLKLIPKVGFYKAVFKTTRKFTVRRMLDYAIYRLKVLIKIS